MKGSKESLTNYLTSQFEKNILNKKKIRVNADLIVREGNLPMIEVIDALTLRKALEDYSERALYYFTKVTDEKLLDEYFSSKEIDEYETNKYKKETVRFPIKWNMIEVTEGMQWIGKITVKELMKLRNAQLIRYNERTQRTMKHMDANQDFRYYQIFLNRKAVNEIIESFDNNQFIPNTITLNLPQDAEFGYKDGKLIISKTDGFDVLDGYHRYIAMSNLYNRNEHFDYTMELRVVCFSEETARQFIWQEDQKTKMKKMDSDSFNQNSPANQVINLINQEGLFRNVIGINKAIIDQGLAANLIDIIYFSKKRKTTRAEILKVENWIVSNFKKMLSFNPTIFDLPWGYAFTIIIFALMDDPAMRDVYYTEVETLVGTLLLNPELNKRLRKRGNPITITTLQKIREVYNEKLLGLEV